MADESLSAVNVDELPVIEEVKPGDFLILENQDGTGIVDYKDFIIGVDNITFSDVLSTHGTNIGTVSTNHATLSTNHATLSAKFDALLALVTANSGLSGATSGQLSSGWAAAS